MATYDEVWDTFGTAFFSALIEAEVVGRRKPNFKGIPEWWKFYNACKDAAEGPEVVDRFKALASMPEGSLGHAYTDLLRKNDLTIPGSVNSMPAIAAVHDMTHIVAEYDTDPEGEILTAAFSTGVTEAGRQLSMLPTYEPMPRKKLLFEADLVYGFRLPGQSIPLLIPYLRLVSWFTHVPIARLNRAYERGCYVKVNLLVDWDYFKDAPRQLVDVRQDLGIEPE